MRDMCRMFWKLESKTFDFVSGSGLCASDFPERQSTPLMRCIMTTPLAAEGGQPSRKVDCLMQQYPGGGYVRGLGGKNGI